MCTLSGLVAQQPEEPAAVPDPSGDYRIGIEDVLRVVVWGEERLSLQAKVRPDGKITIPLVNDIYVVGLTPMEVRDRIETGLSSYVRDPNVTVIVEQINSFRVYFVGEVKSQGAIQFYRPIRLLQAIAAAGGLTEFAKKEVTLVRETEGIEQRIRINYRKLASGDPSEKNPYLKPGDTVICN